jgi:hypothetical protein
MAKKRLYEIFMPPNVLKAKMGAGSSGFDMSAIKRAEAAIAALKSEHPGWLADDVETLTVAFATFHAHPNELALAKLYRSSHDLRGQGVMFDFPLISRVAYLLCELIENIPDPAKLPIALMELHVEAIRVVLRDNIKSVANSTAIELVRELESKGHLASEIAKSQS